MRILATIISLLMIASCITETKVNTWLKNHPGNAAGYCADNFPPDTIARTVSFAFDTGAYAAAYEGLEHYSDSLFMELKCQRESFVPTSQQPCPTPVNLDSLRKAVDFEIRKRLAPCKDSIQKVVYTVVDKAREKQLQVKLDEKDVVITTRDKRISDQDTQLIRLKKWPWLFWVLIALIVFYTGLKLRFKLPF